MNVLLLLVPLSLTFVGAGGADFFWAPHHDQFHDFVSPKELPLLVEDGIGPV